MEISKNNLGYLELIKDIYKVSNACSTKTYIWGGLTIDILESSFLREHGDLDGFIANQNRLLDRLTEMYEKMGYQTHYLHDIKMFKVKKDNVHASFNCVEFRDGIATWKHIGDEG